MEEPSPSGTSSWEQAQCLELGTAPAAELQGRPATSPRVHPASVLLFAAATMYFIPWLVAPGPRGQLGLCTLPAGRPEAK